MTLREIKMHKYGDDIMTDKVSQNVMQQLTESINKWSSDTACRYTIRNPKSWSFKHHKLDMPLVTYENNHIERVNRVLWIHA